MDKSAVLVIRNAKTGQSVAVKGAGALKGSGFAIRKDVDLTKPIAKQVLGKSGQRPAKGRKG